MMFKAGDKIKCIRNIKNKHTLDIGKTYIVNTFTVHSYGKWLTIRGFNPDWATFDSERFVLVGEKINYVSRKPKNQPE
jgi:hypothetical protein